MKKQANLLLTLTIPLLLLNCSNKPLNSYPSNLPTTPTNNTITIEPTLGEPIKRPNTLPTPPAPVIRERPKSAESYLSTKFKLPKTLKESSGLIKVDNRLWTFNDSGGKPKLYQIDEHNGEILKSITIQNAHNRDWEDIAYDENHLYIGDFGNNLGNRRDLKVYKIPRAALRTQTSAKAEVIHFSYSDQKDFKAKRQANNYDCEAMVAYQGKLYLFSKNWLDNKTRLYELSSAPGKHKARYLSSFNIQGKVTGAAINKALGTLILTTYSSLLKVELWAFTNYRGNNFFNGKSKRLNLKNPLYAQVEAVTFIDKHQLYLSSESITKYIFALDASLFHVDFSGEFE